MTNKAGRLNPMLHSTTNTTSPNIAASRGRAAAEQTALSAKKNCKSHSGQYHKTPRLNKSLSTCNRFWGYERGEVMAWTQIKSTRGENLCLSLLFSFLEIPMTNLLIKKNETFKACYSGLYCSKMLKALAEYCIKETQQCC